MYRHACPIVAILSKTSVQIIGDMHWGNVGICWEQTSYVALCSTDGQFNLMILSEIFHFINPAEPTCLDLIKSLIHRWMCGQDGISVVNA